MASSRLVRDVTVVGASKRKLVRVDFSSFSTTTDAIRQKLHLVGEFELQTAGGTGQFYDIEDDDDLAQFKDTHELIVRLATDHQNTPISTGPSGISKPQGLKPKSPVKGKTERRMSVSYGDVKKLVKVSMESFDELKDLIYQKFQIVEDVDLLAKLPDDDEYYNIQDDDDLNDYKDATSIQVRLRQDSLPQKSTPSIVMNSQEKKIPVTFEGNRKPCAVDLQSFDNTIDIIRQRFRIDGDFEILGKLPDSDEYFNIYDDSDMEDFSEAEAFIVKRLSSGVPDQSFAASDSAISSRSVAESNPTALTHPEITATPPATFITQAPAEECTMKSLPVTFEGNCKSVNVDLKCLQGTCDAIRRKFKIEGDLKLIAKHNHSNVQFNIDDDDDLDDLIGADALVVERKLDETCGPIARIPEETEITPLVTSQQLISATSQALAEVNIEENRLQIKIGTEIYPLHEAPSEESAVVLKETKDLAINFDIPALVQKTDIVADCLRLARYGVAGNPDLQMKVGQMLSQVAEISQLTNDSVIQLRMKAGDILDDLMCGFGFLLDGIEDVAMESFDNVRENSELMKARSISLKEALETERNRVKEILASIMVENKSRNEGEEQRQTNIENERKKFLERKIEFAKQDRAAADRRVDNLEAEIETDKGRIKAAMDEKGCGHGCRAGRCCHGSCPCRYWECCFRCCSGGLLCWHSRRRHYWYWSHLRCQNTEAANEKRVSSEKDLLKKAEDDRLAEIGEQVKLREEENKANEELLKYVESLKAYDPAERPEDMSTTALRGAESGILSLQMSLQSTVKFWEKVTDQCESIGNTGTDKVMGNLQKKSAEERKRYFSSPTFKMQAVKYYARWVALRKMCEAFHLSMKGVENNIQISLADNPSIKEARAKIPTLIKGLEKKLLDERRALQASAADNASEVHAIRSGTARVEIKEA